MGNTIKMSCLHPQKVAYAFFCACLFHTCIPYQIQEPCSYVLSFLFLFFFLQHYPSHSSSLADCWKNFQASMYHLHVLQLCCPAASREVGSAGAVLSILWLIGHPLVGRVFSTLVQARHKNQLLLSLMRRARACVFPCCIRRL